MENVCCICEIELVQNEKHNNDVVTVRRGIKALITASEQRGDHIKAAKLKENENKFGAVTVHTECR